MVEPEEHEITFLGLCTYYRWFISRLTDVAKQLTKFTEKQAFQWTPEVEAPLQTFKATPCTPPILAYLQPREKFVVGTHASNVGIGVLPQVQDGQTRVITCYSKTRNMAERN
jgi:hypothetical protein